MTFNIGAWNTYIHLKHTLIRLVDSLFLDMYIDREIDRLRDEQEYIYIYIYIYIWGVQDSDIR